MKIAICSPIHSGAKPQFVQCLSRMIVRTMSATLQENGQPVTPTLETFIFSTSNVAYSRRKLVDIALDWGAHWLLWLDADQIFPPDTLTRLLGRRQAIVGANCRRRDPSAVFPTAYTNKDGKPAPVFPHGDGIEQVLHLGMAVCLTHAEVFRKIGRPYFFEEMLDDGIHAFGEDVSFCHKAREAGFPVHVDHALSMEVGHIADIDLFFPKPEGEAGSLA
jgi:GT2 family glycosyltransferase